MLRHHVRGSSIIPGGQGEEATQCPRTDERTSKPWPVHTTECHPAWNRKAALTPATTRWTLRTCCAKSAGPQSTTRAGSHFRGVPGAVRSTEMKGRKVGPRRPGERTDGELVSDGTEFQFGTMTACWWGRRHDTVNVLNATELGAYRWLGK